VGRAAISNVFPREHGRRVRLDALGIGLHLMM
jgi:hypothetical protein